MTGNSYIFTDSDAISLSIDNKAYNVDSTNSNWEKILDALRTDDWTVIPSLINIAKAVQEYVGFTNIEVNVDYGTITYGGQPLAGVLVDQILKMKDQGFNINPMLKFLDNLMSNPSNRAVNELYSFLQAGGMPITEDGCFIAYKRVRSDYKSVHDGKTDNTPGTRLDMPRNLVNENSNQTCSTGLHFCSHAYLKHFSGDKVVILKVNPRDVVSIPADYNDTKGRASGYDVIGELSPEEVEKALADNIFTEAVYNTPSNLGPVGTVCKESSGWFARGYEAGYEDALADRDYQLSYDVYDVDNYSQEAVYDEGYDKGWDRAKDDLPRQYRYVG